MSSTGVCLNLVTDFGGMRNKFCLSCQQTKVCTYFLRFSAIKGNSDDFRTCINPEVLHRRIEVEI